MHHEIDAITSSNLFFFISWHFLFRAFEGLSQSISQFIYSLKGLKKFQSSQLLSWLKTSVFIFWNINYEIENRIWIENLLIKAKFNSHKISLLSCLSTPLLWWSCHKHFPNSSQASGSPSGIHHLGLWQQFLIWSCDSPPPRTPWTHSKSTSSMKTKPPGKFSFEQILLPKSETQTRGKGKFVLGHPVVKLFIINLMWVKGCWNMLVCWCHC